MDTNTLMLMMMMSGNRSMNNMLPLLLLSGGSLGSLGINQQAMTVGMLGMGTLPTIMLGGIGGLLAKKMFQKPRRRRKTKVVYRYRNRRRYY